MNSKYKRENKKLSDRLSERSHGLMMQKWELERKNISISQKNQEIIDSLNYAKNIQSAILPRDGLISSIFEDAFIFYKPKDIVSGDFYFIEQHGEYIFVAVADCTGHGVAGAFMSMMGNVLLKQIITGKKINDPSAILHHLNEGIVDALRQKENSSHGGMDISLCVINQKKNILDFAGANRPLVLFRNNEEYIYRPDKLPIGGFSPDEFRKFNCQTIPIEKDDRIYLYSDGYSDQFGGMQGKKIISKKFRELLFQIHETNMSKQQKQLELFFETWKGKYEQVDDVLVVGIKL